MKINKKRLALSLILIVSLIFLCIFSFEDYKHLQKVKIARKNFDFKTLETQLDWINKYGVILNEFPQIKDAKLWLRINLYPNKDLIKELSVYTDQKHIFELYEIQLRLGLTDNAVETLNQIMSPERSALGRALLALYTGNPEEAIQRLDTELNWNSLTIDENTLRHILLGQAFLQTGVLTKASSEVQFVKELEPKNPAILIISFHIAVWNHEMKRASELSLLIDNLQWKATNLPYLAEKAILELNSGKMERYNNLVLQITKLGDNANDYINYLIGLQKFTTGNILDSKDYLEKAYKGHLNINFKNDTKSMLDFINARTLAEEKLQHIYQNE